jgi:hypothetical protein
MTAEPQTEQQEFWLLFAVILFTERVTGDGTRSCSPRESPGMEPVRAFLQESSDLVRQSRRPVRDTPFTDGLRTRGNRTPMGRPSRGIRPAARPLTSPTRRDLCRIKSGSLWIAGREAPDRRRQELLGKSRGGRAELENPYACREILDLTGPIGGLNFQAAFATAELAARDAVKLWATGRGRGSVRLVRSARPSARSRRPVCPNARPRRGSTKTRPPRLPPRRRGAAGALHFGRR